MERTIYRLGAELLSVRQFMEKQPEQAGLYHALQAMTSAVEVSGLRTRPPDDPDDRFIAEIALGLLCRGWPTLSSPVVEKTLLNQIASYIGLTVDAGPAHEVTWQLSADEETAVALRGAFSRCLLPIDDRLRTWPEATLRKEGSKAEARFHDEFLPRLLGPLAACVEWQRPLTTMVEDPDERKKVFDQRADFTLEIPAAGDTEAALMLNFEVDGPHHELSEQKAKDDGRDSVLQPAGWIVERIPTEDLTGAWTPGDAIAGAIWDHPATRACTPGEFGIQMHPAAAVLQMAPHAIARIQFAALLALRSRPLSLAGGPWRLLVREREFPAAHLALADLRQLLIRLCDIYDLPGPPDIEAVVEADYPSHMQLASTPATGDALDGVQVVYDRPGARSPRDFDVAIDVSVLCRPNQWYGDERDGDGWLRLRTAYRSAGATPLSWSTPRVIADPRAKAPALEYLLKSCFRKRVFRPGQLEIIERALCRQSVIGLLPTGAGKSLTYQLPALLSPGITLVIDPIKSLMQDQVDNLHESGIDSAVTINSDQTAEEKAASQRRLGAGEVRFGFISPERLQIKGFRETLAKHCNKSPIAFAVIDEAHCVSEWGHDFRTAYLNLGRHVREFLKHEGTEPATIALTGTASRAVLIDVQRELDVEGPDAVIEPDGFDRPELHYDIHEVDSPFKNETVKSAIDLLSAQLESHGLSCTPEMLTSGEAGGILFCPHVDGPFGIFALQNDLKNRAGWSTQIGYYGGKKPQGFQGTDKDWISHKANEQRRFKRSEVSLLAATSAFGMGIDKSNIRYTIHLGMPKSVEALAQEMGRAGRDRNPAVCHVIFSDRGDPDSKDPLQKGIRVEEAKARMNAIPKEQADDAGRMLFLHTTGYHGAEREALDTILYFRKYVRPHWEAHASSSNGTLLTTSR